MKSRSEVTVISRLAILPKASKAARPPGMVPWRRSNSTRTAANRRLQQGFGQGSELLAGHGGADRAREQAGGDEEFLFLADDAGAVDDFLIGARFGEERIDLAHQHVAAGDVVGEGRIDQAIHDMGAVNDRLRPCAAPRPAAAPAACANADGVRSSAKSCMPVGMRDRKLSNRAKASSALPAVPSVARRAGSSSVRWARAAAARVAG